MQNLHGFMSGEGDLRVLTACPFCNTNYTVRAAQVIAKKDDAHVVHIACRHCGGSIVALIVAGGVDAQSIGVITDLSPDEVSRFSRDRAIDTDDALAVHELLSNDTTIDAMYTFASKTI